MGLLKPHDRQAEEFGIDVGKKDGGREETFQKWVGREGWGGQEFSKRARR